MKVLGLFEVISTYKMYVSDFCPDDLRFGQFCDLPIINLWENMKILHVLHKPTETTQFVQDNGHSPLCDDPGATDDRVHGEVSEVTIRLSPISRDRMEIDTHKWCQTTWLVEPLRRICVLIYVGHDLTLT